MPPNSAMGETCIFINEFYCKMKKFGFAINLLLNKYVLSVILFLIWISFFDRNDLFTQWERKQELKKLEQSASYYEKGIADTKKNLTDLNNNPAMLEKFARENFYLKRSNEQVFLVIDSNIQKTN